MRAHRSSSTLAVVGLAFLSLLSTSAHTVRAGETLLGVSRHDLLGKTDRDLFPEKEAEFFQAKDRETLEGRVLVDIPEEPIQTQAGLRLLHTIKVPILDAAGKPRYLLGISEDITQRRAGEDARTRLAAIIERKVDCGLRADLLTVFEACYLGFQIGLWTNARSVAADGERERIDALLERYAHRLRDLIADEA